MQKNRIIWIDIAKGFSIILVVLGHSGEFFGNHYLAWFRMPLFFFLSGLLFKPIARTELLRWIGNKSIRMLIPYFSFGLLILLVFTFIYDRDPFVRFYNLLYGGIKLTGEHGVFWFITCLLLTQIIFGLLSSLSFKIQISLISISYIIAHVMTNTSLKEFAVPWNADVVLITLAYYGMGHYLKEIIINNINNVKLFAVSIIVAVVFIFLDYYDVLSFSFDLKYKNYQNLLLDVIIPFSFLIPVCMISNYLLKFRFSKIISWLGRNTVTIMYLHIPINLIVGKLLNLDYGFIIYTLVGITFPMLIWFLLKQSKVLSFLFLGKKYQKGERVTL